MVSGLVKVISITAKLDETVFKDFIQMYRPKKASFQTPVPCANLIKMKTHFQLIFEELEHYFTEIGEKKHT